ncbi:LOW QUALITY PROTEIN: hypothetical protein Cgig2_025511 [Carnegiea gigantea]|uniref:Pentatricopeptide repeat-containing protein n=1 Tax=Carnegiea gigantea TaxID=171969 RepID=A0A9Q1QCQ9_9CARY|nr:LOW QUALITY PROTEIN: hypothetical protein Cgig2_025511 [Carnegiea gigantea]
MMSYQVQNIHCIHRFLFFTSYCLCHVILAEECSLLLEHCVQSKSLKDGKMIHRHLLKNNYSVISSYLLEKVIYMYISCGRLDLARHVFDEIQNPNVVLWNLMIKTYAWSGPFEFSINLYTRMWASGILPTKFTFPVVLKASNSIGHVEEIHNHILRLGFELDVYISTALVNLYAKCGALVQVENVFQAMSNRDIVAWNAMIAGFSLHGLYDDVIRLIIGMQEIDISPNPSTIVTILPVAIHGCSIRKGFSQEVMLGTSLLDMYGKCGCISTARTIFDRLDSRNEVTWSAMIGSYIMTDHMREALTLFDYILLQDCGTPLLVSLIYALQYCTKLIDLRNGKRIHCRILKSGHLSNLMASNLTLSMYAKNGVLDDAVRFF